MNDSPSRASAVIIGAGIVGNSLAYHLARLGWTELILVDKGPMPNPGGSTGHASNFIFPIEYSKMMMELTRDSTEQYQELGVFTESGGIEVARTPERMTELRRRCTAARAWGIPAALLTPGEVGKLVPYLDESVILGGAHFPTVGVVDSLRAGTLMREQAQQLGALQVLAGAEVTAIDTTADGRVSGVRTNRGDIETEVVAICCGVWSPKVAALAGARIPLTPIVHQMISVGPVPLFADTTGEIEYPIIRDVDTNMYERQHGGDLEVGSYAHRPIIVTPADIPSNEQAVLSPTEMPFTPDDFDPQLAQALELMPDLLGDERVGIRYAINGLISMTPDGHPLLGESPEVPGLWSAAASWIKEGPGVGRAVAEWMSGVTPEVDIREADIARFYGHQKTTAHVEARAREGFNKMYGIVHPAEQWESGRPLRLSPVYERERALGAAFVETAGWERPHWYASNENLLDRYAGRLMERTGEWESRWWSPIINAEHLALRDAAGLVDLTAFAVFDVSGPGALRTVQSVAVAQMDVAPGRVVYTSLLDEAGGFVGDLTIMRLGPQRFRVVTGGATGMSDLKWFADHLPDDGTATITDLTSAWTTLGLWGPAPAPSWPRSPAPTCRTRASVSVPAARSRRPALTVLASRISYVGELGWELHAPIEAGRPAVGRAARGGHARRAGPGRHRRVRHHRPAGEGLPGLRRRARRPLQPDRGGHGPAPGQGPGLHRQGRVPGPAGRPARRHPVHAHGRRPRQRVRRASLHARRRADPDPRRRVAGRQPGPHLLRDQRRVRPVGRPAPADGLPAARAGRGRHAARGRVPGRALPGHRGRRRGHAPVRPGQRPDPQLTWTSRSASSASRRSAAGS